MKTILIILVLLIPISSIAQVKVDSVTTTMEDIHINFNETNWVKATKFQIATVNLAAMLILSEKYKWTENTQNIATFAIIGGAMIFTFSKTIQYDYKKKKYNKLWKNKIYSISKMR